MESGIGGGAWLCEIAIRLICHPITGFHPYISGSMHACVYLYIFCELEWIMNWCKDGPKGSPGDKTKRCNMHILGCLDTMTTHWKSQLIIAWFKFVSISITHWWQMLKSHTRIKLINSQFSVWVEMGEQSAWKEWEFVYIWVYSYISPIPWRIKCPRLDVHT